MKKKDIRLGETYYTRVGGALVAVIPYAIKVSGKRDAFRVKRADNGQELPKPRTAAALRLEPKAIY